MIHSDPKKNVACLLVVYHVFTKRACIVIMFLVVSLTANLDSRQAMPNHSRFFVAKTISARSFAISRVAVGLAAISAACFISAIFSDDASHELTVSAITVGSPLNFPNPEFSTYSTLPSS
jgi:hypothetical protein